MISNKEIITKLKSIYQLKSDGQLARELDASKQTVSQFAKKSGFDVNNKIISKLIADIENYKSQEDRTNPSDRV